MQWGNEISPYHRISVISVQVEENRGVEMEQTRAINDRIEDMVVVLL
jgi:hypothetical protein